MKSKESEIIDYINSLLIDTYIPSEIPDSLLEVEGLDEIDNTIKTLRQSINRISNGELSNKINGRGYLIGTIKNLQASLKNLIWQTKVISSGDFSQRVDFLGDFSDAFNSMVKKLESTILEVTNSKEIFELFFDTIPDPTLIVSYEDMKIYNCNFAFESITGYRKDKLIGKTLYEINFFKNSKQIDEFVENVKNQTKPNHLSLELDINSQKLFYGLFSSAIVKIDCEPYILSVIKDITELKLLENRLRDSEETHRLLADNATDVIWTMDLSGKFTYISPSVEKLRGFTVEEVKSQSKEELVCKESVIYLEQGLKDAIYSVENNLPFKVFRGDVEQPCKDGTTVWTDLTVSGIYDKDNNFLGMLGVSRDITERKRMEEEIRLLTEVDRLTQLFNRLKLDSVIKYEIERTKRSLSPLSIILMDIDHFKLVNDNFGHIVGDEVLKEVAKIIKESIRKVDTAGRWGGEEFMIVLPDSDLDGGRILAEKIRTKIESNDFSKVGRLTASFGVAEFKDGISEIEFVNRADNAMYQAKNQGRNKVCVS